MLKRICDFCEKKNPDYAIRCQKTYHRLIPSFNWQNVDICKECYNKLFPKVENKPPKAISAER